MVDNTIALQARAPRIISYNELVAGRDQQLARRNAMAAQQMQMQQLQMQQEEAAKAKADMRQALALAQRGDLTGAQEQYGLGAGNMEVYNALNKVRNDQTAQLQAKLTAIAAPAIAALGTSDPAARAAIFQEAAPALMAQGWTAEQISQFPLGDDDLKRAINNAQSPEKALEAHFKSQEPYTLAPGAARFAGGTKIAEQPANTPQGSIQTIIGADGKPQMVRVVDGIAYPLAMGDSGGLVGGSRGGADTVYGHGQFGQPSKPISQSTIGEVQDYQRGSLIPATRGKVGAGPDQGTGAVGTYQITYGTLKNYAPKVLGPNWRNTPFTAEVQDQLARAIYEDSKNGDLSKIWAGLPSNRPGAYSNVPWEQARVKIAQAESGGGGNAPVRPAAKDQGGDTKTTESERRFGTIAAQMRTNLREAVSILSRSTSAAKPSTSEYIASQIPFYGEEAQLFAQSEDRQKLVPALLRFLDNVTYVNTGAGTSKTQEENYRRSYIPTYQDKPGAAYAKLKNMIEFAQNVKNAAGKVWPQDMDADLAALRQAVEKMAPRGGGGGGQRRTPVQSSGGWGSAKVVGG